MLQNVYIAPSIYIASILLYLNSIPRCPALPHVIYFTYVLQIQRGQVQGFLQCFLWTVACSYLWPEEFGVSGALYISGRTVK
jgi:hypothetical protein